MKKLWFIVFAIFICAVFPLTVYSTSVDDAVNWAEDQIGETWNVSSECDQSHAWDGWCGRFVGHAYGNCTYGFPRAIDGWNDSGITFGEKNICENITLIPRGALVFFDQNLIADGHASLYVGNGEMIHAWTSGVIKTFSCFLSELELDFNLNEVNMIIICEV